MKSNYEYNMNIIDVEVILIVVKPEYLHFRCAVNIGVYADISMLLSRYCHGIFSFLIFLIHLPLHLSSPSFSPLIHPTNILSIPSSLPLSSL